MLSYPLTLLLSCAPILAFLIIGIAMELTAPRQRYSLGSRWPGGLWLFIQPGLFMLAAYPITSLWRRLGMEPVFDLTPLGFLAGVAAMLLLVDGLRYLGHRIEHKICWPFHAVHHSIRELHSANSFAHPVEGLVEAFCVVIPLSLIHVPREVVLVAGAIIGLQSVVIHAPTRLHMGPLRAILVDSRFHRIHHSVEAVHFDKNFGFLFSFWDRLFGTLHDPAPSEWPATGIDDLPPPRTFAGMLAHPLQHFGWHRASRRTSG
ncbi:sterol desaturase family protein [Novosphingobium sp. G106]|uniref:sterol desaturase family protein n=1 Tax=Novosphingobium sp. G106 TaxID=2849500 RepID=UPI001C2D1387|nr:sterol desaturase family protein [Novosphingobium sp. G106]MBV1691522.1 sterol desaturase family protein [Novosphingobium sp. G106]